jgi:hypothetical protein
VLWRQAGREKSDLPGLRKFPGAHHELLEFFIEAQDDGIPGRGRRDGRKLGPEDFGGNGILRAARCREGDQQGETRGQEEYVVHVGVLR